MRILLTGNEGFVGSHIQNALKAEHEIVGLEAKETFREWYDDMDAVMDTPIDAVAHVGAISDNQCADPSIYLWNSYATFLLAQCTRQKMDSMSPIPFIFFSSFLVEATLEDWASRTPYAWSKAQGEHFVQAYLPHATILRPVVMWGNESMKQSTKGSLPYRLASHSLEYLFRNWKRTYVHVDDVVEAVRNCLENRHQGTYRVASPYMWPNEELSKLVEWAGYQWVDDSRSVGFNYVSDYGDIQVTPLVPDWEPQRQIEIELPKLERLLMG